MDVYIIFCVIGKPYFDILSCSQKFLEVKRLKNLTKLSAMVLKGFKDTEELCIMMVILSHIIFKYSKMINCTECI
jgi:hypothetical protein